MIDWQRVKEALERKDGVAHDVTMHVATSILSTSSAEHGRNSKA
jgi:hypothetical protein